MRLSSGGWIEANRWEASLIPRRIIPSELKLIYTDVGRKRGPLAHMFVQQPSAWNHIAFTPEHQLFGLPLDSTVGAHGPTQKADGQTIFGPDEVRLAGHVGNDA